MSLFTLREVWSVDFSERVTSFTNYSITIANIDNEAEGFRKIIIGSLTGVLRIISSSRENPSTDLYDEDGESSLFKSDLLAEIQFPSPILQVETGRFASGSDKLQLAILFPHKLGIYSVSKVGGEVGHGSQWRISLLYEHNLKRSAFNMVIGPFGHGDNLGFPGKSVRGVRHFLCVQSLDGTLSFFEQEVFTFSRYLPNFLFPGPLTYVWPWDAFITVSGWRVESFKYSNLAMSRDESHQGQDSSIGKRLQPDWTFYLSEEPIGNIQVLVNTPTNKTAPNVKLLVATFNYLFCFGIGGTLIWSKRLDFNPASFHSYLIGPEEEVVTLIPSSSEPPALYIYNQTTLKWAAKLPFAPNYVGRVDLDGIEGGIVLLSGKGNISVGYLGMEPSLFVAPPVQSRDLDYDAAEKELNQLRKVINESNDEQLSARKENNVEIKVEFEGQTTKWIEKDGMEVSALIATIKILCRVRVNDVRVTIVVPKPLVCSEESLHIGDIVGRHTYQVEFYIENEAIPSTLDCEMLLFYLNISSTPHFVHKAPIRIPLFIVAKSNETIEKTSDIKLTFALNKPVVNLVTLYNDFDWKGEASPVNVTFHLYGKDKVTLMASTKANTSSTSRYRIQANSLAAIHLIFKDFCERLQRKFGKEKADFSITLVGYENEIPFLTEFFNDLDAHILRRRREATIREELSGRAAQLRAVQRRLLFRFRDKNPIPLTQLEILFDGSLDHINDALNFLEENDLEQEKTESGLSGALRLILELIMIQSGRTLEEFSLLFSALHPSVSDYIEEKGWEENVLSALTFLKSQVSTLQTFDTLDPSKLKKAIKSALEKVRKSVGRKGDVLATFNPSSDEKKEEGQTEKLVGNEISERMASARSRTAKKLNPVLAPIPEPVDELETRSPSPPSRLIEDAQLVVEEGEDTETRDRKHPLKVTSTVGVHPSQALIENGETKEPEEGFW